VKEGVVFQSYHHGKRHVFQGAGLVSLVAESFWQSNIFHSIVCVPLLLQTP
jgi:hypothetical protein